MNNRHLRRAAASEARQRKSWDWVDLAIDPRLFERAPACRNVVRVVRNDFWVVQVYLFVSPVIGDMVHLAIRSVADNTQHAGALTEPSWRDLQRIKNDLCGAESEALQVYPRQSDVVDQANMYHLFVLPSVWPLPFGLHRENGFVRGPR